MTNLPPTSTKCNGSSGTNLESSAAPKLSIIYFLGVGGVGNRRSAGHLKGQPSSDLYRGGARLIGMQTNLSVSTKVLATSVLAIGNMVGLK